MHKKNSTLLIIYRMVVLPVDVFVFIARWPLYPHMGAVDVSEDTREAGEKGKLRLLGVGLSLRWHVQHRTLVDANHFADHVL